MPDTSQSTPAIAKIAPSRGSESFPEAETPKTGSRASSTKGTLTTTIRKPIVPHTRRLPNRRAPSWPSAARLTEVAIGTSAVEKHATRAITARFGTKPSGEGHEEVAEPRRHGEPGEHLRARARQVRDLTPQGLGREADDGSTASTTPTSRPERPAFSRKYSPKKGKIAPSPPMKRNQ